ncbi:unnamed protein product [Sphagnum balticum]
MSHFGRAGPPDIRDTYSLLVLNITFRTSADDLFPLFDRYGKVVDIFIPRDRRTGESRGFAFVRYKYADEAQKAVEHLDGRNVDGRDIVVQYAKYGRNDESIQRGRITQGSPKWRSRSRSRSPRRSRHRDEHRHRDYRTHSISHRDERHDRDHHRSHERGRDSRRRSPSRSVSRSRSRGRDNVGARRRTESISVGRKRSPVASRRVKGSPMRSSPSPAARSVSASPDLKVMAPRSASPEEPGGSLSPEHQSMSAQQSDPEEQYAGTAAEHET